MTEKDNGGAAFPRTGAAIHRGYEMEYAESQSGMSLRDWLAGRAMASLLITTAAVPREKLQMTLRNIAEQAYDAADMMLEVRAK